VQSLQYNFTRGHYSVGGSNKILKEMEEKSLDQWRVELRLYGKRYWLKLYEAFMGQPVSNSTRLYRCVNLYGELIVLDAIVDSSNRDLNGDKLNYVAKVASLKWKEAQREQDSESEYVESINRAKERSRLQNNQLQKKIKAAKPRTRRKK
jgi:hypothetical protein